jgi:hypothetical protein
MEITIFYPDGTSENRPLTQAEIDQAQRDALEVVDRAWANLRAERNAILSSCDWTVLGDSPTPTAAWKAYRQQLRDLPANTTDPLNAVWPTPPS